MVLWAIEDVYNRYTRSILFVMSYRYIYIYIYMCVSVASFIQREFCFVAAHLGFFEPTHSMQSSRKRPWNDVCWSISSKKWEAHLHRAYAIEGFYQSWSPFWFGRSNPYSIDRKKTCLPQIRLKTTTKKTSFKHWEQLETSWLQNAPKNNLNLNYNRLQ